MHSCNQAKTLLLPAGILLAGLLLRP